MNVNDLVTQLQELQEKGYGGLQVRVYADHGQLSVPASGVHLAYIEEDAYMAEGIHEDDLCDYPDAVPVIEIR